MKIFLKIAAVVAAILVGGFVTLVAIGVRFDGEMQKFQAKTSAVLL